MRDRSESSVDRSPDAVDPLRHLAPAWLDFIRFCQELRYGEIERLSVQDGVPVIAETVRTKVKFKK